MKVHILDSFPGDSKGKTKELDEITAKELIKLEQAVSAEDGKTHPEAKENKEAEGRKDKTNKGANATQTK